MRFHSKFLFEDNFLGVGWWFDFWFKWSIKRCEND